MRPTVFLVDDDEESGRFITSSVAPAEADIRSFAAARDFFKAFDPTRPGCVICHDHAGGTSGLDLLKRVRATGSAIPVLFVTSRGNVRAAVNAMKAGAIDVLEQPVPPDVLLEHVLHAIERDAADRAAQATHVETVGRFRTLSERERQVFWMVVGGAPNREIAERLGASPKTIEAQRGSVMRKMEAESVPHLVRMSIGLPAPEAPDDPPSSPEARP